MLKCGCCCAFNICVAIINVCFYMLSVLKPPLSSQISSLNSVSTLEHNCSNSLRFLGDDTSFDAHYATTYKPHAIVAAVILALLSAIFSGLTLGLMTLDVVQLRVLMDTATKSPEDQHAIKDALRAKRIYRLRRDGNLLLVTLVVSNVAVNSAFSIISSDLTSGLVGFLISTIIITVVGEIIPQSFCARYGLAIGYYLAPLVYVVEAILYVVVKPMALFLDCMFGKDLGTRYNREQLKAFLAHHEKEVKLLGMDETRILSGGLEIASKTVGQAMTPLHRVYGLDIDETLDFTTAANIILSGYSRVPVFDRFRQQSIIGLLYTKDLALVEPELHLPIRSVLPMLGRSVYGVDVDAKLLDILAEFKKGRSHFAVVREVVCLDKGDPYYRHVGIITLEDIIEEILQDEIRDEYEQAIEEPQLNQQTSSLKAQKDKIIETYDPLSDKCVSQSPWLLPFFKLKKRISSASPSQQIEGTQCTAGSASDDVLTRLSDVSLSAAPHIMIPASSHIILPGTKEMVDTQKEHLSSQKESIISIMRSASISRDPVSDTHNIEDNGNISSASPSAALSSDKEKMTTPPLFSKDEHIPQRSANRLQLFNKRLEPLSSDEISAISLFLASTQIAFRSPYVKQRVLKKLLLECSVCDPMGQFYTRGLPADYMILILQGRVCIVCGEDEISSIVGPWKVLGVKALGPPDISQLTSGLGLPCNMNSCETSKKDCANALRELDIRFSTWASSYSYIPDFSAERENGILKGSDGLKNLTSHNNSSNGISANPLRCLKITRVAYVQALRGN